MTCTSNAEEEWNGSTEPSREYYAKVARISRNRTRELVALVEQEQCKGTSHDGAVDEDVGWVAGNG